MVGLAEGEKKGGAGEGGFDRKAGIEREFGQGFGKAAESGEGVAFPEMNGGVFGDEGLAQKIERILRLAAADVGLREIDGGP